MSTIANPSITSSKSLENIEIMQPKIRSYTFPFMKWNEFIRVVNSQYKMFMALMVLWSRKGETEIIQKWCSFLLTASVCISWRRRFVFENCWAGTVTMREKETKIQRECKTDRQSDQIIAVKKCGYNSKRWKKIPHTKCGEVTTIHIQDDCDDPKAKYFFVEFKITKRSVFLRKKKNERKYICR